MTPQVITLVRRPGVLALVAVDDSAVEDQAHLVVQVLAPRTEPQVLRSFPIASLYDFPRVLSEALPELPAPLEYRLLDNDLVIRDAETDIVVAVLRDATATAAVTRR